MSELPEKYSATGMEIVGGDAVLVDVVNPAYLAALETQLAQAQEALAQSEALVRVHIGTGQRLAEKVEKLEQALADAERQRAHWQHEAIESVNAENRTLTKLAEAERERVRLDSQAQKSWDERIAFMTQRDDALAALRELLPIAKTGLVGLNRIGNNEAYLRVERAEAVLAPTEAAVSTTHPFDEWAYDHNCVICRRPRSEHPTEAAGWVCANCQQENQAANFRCWACQWDKPTTEAVGGN